MLQGSSPHENNLTTSPAFESTGPGSVRGPRLEAKLPRASPPFTPLLRCPQPQRVPLESPRCFPEACKMCGLGSAPGVRERRERGGALRRAGGVDVTSLCRSHLQNACMTHTLLHTCHGGRAKEREKSLCVSVCTCACACMCVCACACACVCVCVQKRDDRKSRHHGGKRKT